MVNKSGRPLMEEVLRKFDASRVVGGDVRNILAEKEKADLSKFKKHNINIPWYLLLFSKKIINIAYASFKNGLSENRTDTVTFKRPTPYKAKK